MPAAFDPSHLKLGDDVFPCASHQAKRGLEDVTEQLSLGWYPFWRKQAGKKTWYFLCFFCCLLFLGYNVSSCRCERGRGWVGEGVEGGLGGFGGRMLPSLRKACAHTNTHASAHRLMPGQCWLQMLAKSVWRTTNVHPSKHELARRASVTRARKRQHRGALMFGHRVAIIASLYSTQLDSNVLRYTRSLFGGIEGFQP